MQSTTISLTRSRGRFALRALGAILLLFVGADHYYEYSVDQYSVLPTIATLHRLLHRFGRAALLIATASGFAIAATSLVALLVSEQTILFGFMESNYRPAILVAIASEAAVAVCLGLSAF